MNNSTFANAGQISFVETEEALKMSPGQDAHLKLNAKKTVILLKIPYCKIVESMCSLQLTLWASTGFIKKIWRKHLLMTEVCARWVP